jgi:hypothetical protein
MNMCFGPTSAAVLGLSCKMDKHSGDRELIPAHNTNKQTTCIRDKTGEDSNWSLHSQHPFKHRADIFVWFREAINNYCKIEAVCNAIYIQYILSISFCVLNSMHCMHLIKCILLFLYFIISVFNSIHFILRIVTIH